MALNHNDVVAPQVFQNTSHPSLKLFLLLYCLLYYFILFIFNGAVPIDKHFCEWASLGNMTQFHLQSNVHVQVH